MAVSLAEKSPAALWDAWELREKWGWTVAIDVEILDYLESLTVVEPSHRPFNVRGMRALAEAFPKLPRSPASTPQARPVIVAHFGGGASICAMLDGRSVETTTLALTQPG